MKLIPHVVTRTVARQILKTKKNSPHIFFVGGVVGVVGSTVLACRATLKLEPVLDEISQDMKMVKNTNNLTNQTESEYYRDLGRMYGRSAFKLGKLYGPSLAVGTVSIAALTGSHVQLTRRNAALTATLAAVSKAYEDYRLRVQEEIGKDRELEIYRDIRDEKIEGQKELVKATPGGWSPYARCFDESNVNFVKDSELNRIFIECQLNYFNHRLQTHGHVFLNEVYDHLGFERTREGSVVGWLRDGKGDGYVDFGIFEAYNTRFLTGSERAVWLDFNVDGVMYDKI